MQAAAIFTPYFRQKRNIFYFFGILNAEKRKNRKNMEGNWILKIYINNKSTANIETTIQRWKHVRRKGNHYVGNYIKKPKKEIAKLRRLGIKYDCYRVEYERANNYRQTFFSRTSGPYTCRYCNKKLSKTQVYVDHIVPVSKVQKTNYAKMMLNLSRYSNVNDIKNLAPACRTCNLKKSDKMGVWIIRGWLGKYKAYWIILAILKFLGLALMLLGTVYIFKLFGWKIPYL